MAELTITLHGVNSEKELIKSPLFFEFVSSADAACDSLRFGFLSTETPFEVDRVTMELGGEKIFFGLCDKQKCSYSKSGFVTQIFARSSAAVLVDNEANPATYYSPSVNVLFHAEAKRFGFKNKLPELAFKHEYTVPKGTSCYGAINSLVKTATGKSIAVNSENEIVIPNGGKTVDLDGEKIISEVRTINRVKPLTEIDYKISGDSAFIRHFKSRLGEEAGILRTRKTNISALPLWQQEYALKDRLEASFKSYRLAEFVVDGCKSYELYSNVKYSKSNIGALDGYSLRKLIITQNEKGESTALTFAKEIDLKEINYVAE